MQPHICLMYHEIEAPGRPVVDGAPGYLRYVVRLDDFRAQLDQIVSAGLRGLSLSQALRDGSSPSVVITFDDGCESDWLVAAPELHARGLGATFYITTGFLGRRGYLTRSQVRELADAGFDIGCHTESHRFLTDLSGRDIRAEIGRSRDTLEEIIARPVVHLSCPGGRWSAEVATIARKMGYRTVATSRVGANDEGTDAYALARNAVYRHTSPDAFERMVHGRGLRRQRLQQLALDTVKRAVGNGWYVKLRELSLGGTGGRQ
jgi:peptidoglycan/xylan/chitin deacetylase (PgdA/CDA1 family)